MIVAVAAAALVGNNAFRQQGTAEELLELGERYLLELDYEKALVQFLRVVDLEPMHPRGYTGAAEAYWGLGRTEDAIAVLEKGLSATNAPGIAAMLEMLWAADEEEAQVDAPEDTENTNLKRLLSQAVQNGDLIAYQDLSLHGHPIERMDIGTMQDILRSNGYTIVFREGDEENQYDWFGASLEDEWYRGAHISGLQYYGTDYLPHWIFQHSFNNQEYAPLSIGALQTLDTPEVFFSKWGFFDTAEIGAELRRLGAQEYAIFDEIPQAVFGGSGWSGRAGEWRIFSSNSGGTETNDGGYRFTSIEFTLTNVDHEGVKFICSFESNWDEQNGIAFEDFYLTSFNIYFN